MVEDTIEIGNRVAEPIPFSTLRSASLQEMSTLFQNAFRELGTITQGEEENLITKYRAITTIFPKPIPKEAFDTAIAGARSTDSETERMGKRIVTLLSLPSMFTAIQPYLSNDRTNNEDILGAALDGIITRIDASETTPSAESINHIVNASVVNYIATQEVLPKAWIDKSYSTILQEIDKALEKYPDGLGEEAIEPLAESLSAITGKNIDVVRGIIRVRNVRLLGETQDVVSADLSNIYYTSMLGKRIKEVLNTLDEKEAEFIRMSFGVDQESEPKNRKEIAAAFGMTLKQLHSIETKALEKLRHWSRKEMLKEFLEGQPVTNLPMADIPEIASGGSSPPRNEEFITRSVDTEGGVGIAMIDRVLGRRGLDREALKMIQDNIDWPAIILVPTKSTVKINFLKDMLSHFAPAVTVLGINVESGVNEQPFGPETEKGARTRAANAKALIERVKADPAETTGDPELDRYIRGGHPLAYVGSMENGMSEGVIDEQGNVQLNPEETQFNPNNPHFDYASVLVNFLPYKTIYKTSPTNEAVMIDPVDAQASADSGFTVTAGKLMAERLGMDPSGQPVINHQNWHNYAIRKEIEEAERRQAIGEPLKGLHTREFEEFDRNEQLAGVLFDAFYELATSSEVAIPETDSQKTKSFFLGYGEKVKDARTRVLEIKRQGNIDIHPRALDYTRAKQALRDLEVVGNDLTHTPTGNGCRVECVFNGKKVTVEVIKNSGQDDGTESKYYLDGYLLNKERITTDQVPFLAPMHTLETLATEFGI